MSVLHNDDAAAIAAATNNIQYHQIQNQTTSDTEYNEPVVWALSRSHEQVKDEHDEDLSTSSNMIFPLSQRSRGEQEPAKNNQ